MHAVDMNTKRTVLFCQTMVSRCSDKNCQQPTMFVRERLEGGCCCFGEAKVYSLYWASSLLLNAEALHCSLCDVDVNTRHQCDVIVTRLVCEKQLMHDELTEKCISLLPSEATVLTQLKRYRHYMLVIDLFTH